MTEARDRIPLRTVPDLRGLEAEDASGLCVGRLWGALAEADTGLLRYLDLQLTRRPRHVLVPIGHTRIRGKLPDGRVRLRAALLEELEAIPAFESDPARVTDPYERALVDAHGRSYHGERYYAHPSFDHRGLFAGEHPLVAAGPVALSSTPLQPLVALPEYRIAEGEPDIRGWEVQGSGDVVLGTVHDVIVDPAAGKVRYLVIEGRGRQLPIPVGYVQLDDGAHCVRLPALGTDDLAALPSWTGGALERTDEESVRVALEERLQGGRRYARPEFSTLEIGALGLE